MITNLDSFGDHTMTDKLNLNTIQTDKLKTVQAGVRNQDFRSVAKNLLSSKNVTKTDKMQVDENTNEMTKSEKTKKDGREQE